MSGASSIAQSFNRPVVLFNRGGCGSPTATDLLSGDNPQILDPIARANAAPALASSETKLCLEVDAPFKLIGQDGTDFIQHFHGGSGAMLTHVDGSSVSDQMKLTSDFSAFCDKIQASIESVLRATWVPGKALDEHTLNTIRVQDPGLNFRNPAGKSLKELAVVAATAPQGSVARANAEMYILVGGTQGRRVTITDFSANAAARAYTARLHAEICDHFGVDEDDLKKAPPLGRGIPHPLAAFWVLQHCMSRGAGSKHVAFVVSIDADVDIGGSF